MMHTFFRNSLIAAIFGATVGGGIAAEPIKTAAPSPAQATGSHPRGFSQLADSKISAVVSVIATQGEVVTGGGNADDDLPPSMRDYMEKYFGEEGKRPPREGPFPKPSINSLGSGFIIDPAGYIVTNNHVVENAQSIKVVLQDETEIPATIVGRDGRTDLALLKVETEQQLPHFNWGNSEKNARVGDWVLAIGNPFGLGGTVTAGIVSARARDIHAGPYDDFIQTDAAINRGNSGGPLIDVNGDVVGVNAAIFSPTGGNIGIGFAVPSAVAKPIVQELRSKGSVKRGWLGVQIQSVTKELADAMGRSDRHGALATVVTQNGPAAKAGIKPGDIIVEFNETKIEKLRDLPRSVAQAEVGSKAKVVVWRDDKRIVVEPMIARLDDDSGEAVSSAGRARKVPENTEGPLGLTVVPLTKEYRSKLGLPPDGNGVLVDNVARGSPAEKQNIQAGDIIIQAGTQKVTSPKEVNDAIARAREAKKKAVALLLLRGPDQRFVAIPLTTEGDIKG